MKILITNDDGIRAEGIRTLAELALDFGEVTVIAPKEQCSAMSHRITFLHPLTVEKVDDFPVKGVKEAWQVDGTPADCIKAGMEYVFKEGKPDIVFSGINDGYNSGQEILYSGTVGAAMDALIYGVPAIAYSIDMNKEFGAIRSFFKEVTREVFKKGLFKDKIWNINIPGTPPEEIKGIRYDRTPANIPYYHDYYEITEMENGVSQMKAVFKKADSAPKGSDIEALINKYISVGTLKNLI